MSGLPGCVRVLVREGLDRSGFITDPTTSARRAGCGAGPSGPPRTTARRLGAHRARAAAAAAPGRPAAPATPRGLAAARLHWPREGARAPPAGVQAENPPSPALPRAASPPLVPAAAPSPREERRPGGLPGAAAAWGLGTRPGSGSRRQPWARAHPRAGSPVPGRVPPGSSPPQTGRRDPVRAGCCASRGIDAGLGWGARGEPHCLLIFIKATAPSFKSLININFRLNIYMKEIASPPVREPVRSWGWGGRGGKRGSQGPGRLDAVPRAAVEAVPKPRRVAPADQTRHPRGPRGQPSWVWLQSQCFELSTCGADQSRPL